MSKIRFQGIIDTTLRDGQQSPLLFMTHKYRFDLDDKLQLVHGLVKLGVRHIELFSPVVGETERSDFLELKDYARSLDPDVILLAHCRCHDADIQEALSCGFDGLNLYMGVSRYAQNYSYGRDFQQILDIIKNTIWKTRQQNPGLYIRFSVEDSFRTPIQDVFRVYDEIHEYVDTFGMPDTVGIATPSRVERRVKALKLRYPNVNLECHFHNDSGYSLVNAITAVRCGIEYVDASIWGLAERSGITSLTGFLLDLAQISEESCNRYSLDLCYPLNVLMGSILKTQIPYTEPVSLTNRTHTAGVHQKAVLNNKRVYEGHDLTRFGVTGSQILLGPLSGWNSIYYYLKEIEGCDVSEDLAKDIAAEFKRQAGSINEHLDPEKLLHRVFSQYLFKRKWA